MRVVLQSEGQDAFILEESEKNFYLLDRRVMRRFGPAPELRFTRHGRWLPFAGSPERVLELYEQAETASLEPRKG
jgi:hypothetical protein